MYPGQSWKQARVQASQAAAMVRTAVYTAAVPKEAESALAAFVLDSGGQVSTDMLSQLYLDSPWLARAVGGMNGIVEQVQEHLS